MKKAFFVFTAVLLCLVILAGCSASGYSNLLLFTDRLSETSGKEYSLEDYSVSGSSRFLLMQREGCDVLIRGEEDERSNLRQVSVTLSKVDEKGKGKTVSDSDALFYKSCVQQVIYAFTLFNEEKSRVLAEKILPTKGADLLRTGELTADADNFSLVYYSNGLCCRFTVTDTYLEKTEPARKPG